MIGQYLPNNNETATVTSRQKFYQLNSPKNKTGECPTSMQYPAVLQTRKIKRKRKQSNNKRTDQMSPTSIHVGRGHCTKGRS
jgi:hypothetical protein